MQGLGQPKGIRLSDITDTDATVHWTVPHYHIDSYRVTYAPIHEGKWSVLNHCPVEESNLLFSSKF